MLVSQLSILLLKTLLGLVNIVDFFRLHFLVQVEIEKESLNMNYRSLTNFAVDQTHVTTIVTHIEVLFFFVRDLDSF